MASNIERILVVWLMRAVLTVYSVAQLICVAILPAAAPLNNTP